MILNIVNMVKLWCAPQARHRNLSCMLLTTSMVFVILTAPTVLIRCLAYGDVSINVYVLAASKIMLVINYAINFLVYVLIGRRFRRHFLQLFKRGHAVAPTSANSSAPH